MNFVEEWIHGNPRFSKFIFMAYFIKSLDKNPLLEVIEGRSLSVFAPTLDITLEPITSETVSHNSAEVYNSSGLVIGETGRFKFTVNGTNPHNEFHFNAMQTAISWQTIGSISISNISTNGRDIVITVEGGNTEGPASLAYKFEPNIKFDMLVIPEVVNQATLYIVESINGDQAATSNQMQSLLDLANEYLTQVGVRVEISSVVVHKDTQFTSYYNIDNEQELIELTSRYQNTNTIEIYAVNSLPNGILGWNFSVGDLRDGFAITPGTSGGQVTAHEILHVHGGNENPGLEDIYTSRADLNTSINQLGIDNDSNPKNGSEYIPKDWSIYYNERKLSNVVNRLMMSSNNGAFDIPLGSVLGVGRDNQRMLINVGLTGLGTRKMWHE